MSVAHDVLVSSELRSRPRRPEESDRRSRAQAREVSQRNVLQVGNRPSTTSTSTPSWLMSQDRDGRQHRSHPTAVVPQALFSASRRRQLIRLRRPVQRTGILCDPPIQPCHADRRDEYVRACARWSAEVKSGRRRGAATERRRGPTIPPTRAGGRTPPRTDALVPDEDDAELHLMARRCPAEGVKEGHCRVDTVTHWCVRDDTTCASRRRASPERTMLARESGGGAAWRSRDAAGRGMAGRTTPRSASTTSLGGDRIGVVRAICAERLPPDRARGDARACGCGCRDPPRTQRRARRGGHLEVSARTDVPQLGRSSLRQAWSFRRLPGLFPSLLSSRFPPLRLHVARHGGRARSRAMGASERASTRPQL